MNSPLRTECSRLPTAVRAACLLRHFAGLALPDHRWPILRASLERLAPGAGVDAVLERIEAGDARARQALLAAVTVPETYLFRHPAHFEALAEHALAAAREGRPYRVLSAGCATGEEAWSAAAVLDTVARRTGLRWEVVGWDLDAGRIERARAGRYSAWSVRSGLAGHEHAFLTHGQEWIVHPRLRDAVHFQSVTLEPGFTPHGAPFDVVFLRNVAIYWAPDCASAMIDAVAKLVRPGGMLLLGASEPEQLPRDEWQLEWRSSVRVATRRPCVAKPTARPAPAVRPRTRAPQAQPTVPVRGRAEGDLLVHVSALADRGCYLEALALLDSLPPSPDAEHYLWRGILYSSLGLLDEAVDALRKAVFLAPDDPRCRQWLAVIFDACGHSQAADRELRNLRELTV